MYSIAEWIKANRLLAYICKWITRNQLIFILCLLVWTKIVFTFSIAAVVFPLLLHNLPLQNEAVHGNGSFVAFG